MSLLDDLKGKRFGNVVITHRVEGPQPKTSRWAYLCDCGKTGETYRHSLINGTTISCGCLRRFHWKGISFRSRMEIFTAMALEILEFQFEYETKTFSIEIGGKTRKYTPDFHLPQENIWIEVKGTTFREGVSKFLEFKKSHQARLVNQQELRILTNRSLTHLYREWLSGPEACYSTIERGLSDPEAREKAMALITGGA